MVFLRMRRAASFGGGGLLLAMVVAAEMVTFEVRDVPVGRLTANIERRIAASPRDVQLRVNLARAHVMAYSLKKSALPVATHDPDKPFDGYLKENVQPEVRKTSNAEEARRALEHLQQAIRVYREALAIDEKHPLANLGYAWALMESGERDAAIAAFRRTVAMAWPGDRGRDMNMYGWRSVTEEATRHLIGLLDPRKDAAEIASLKDIQSQIEKMPRAITPVVVPLRDGLGADGLVDAAARVRFDADGTGRRLEWTWFTRDAGILVWDPRQRGEVTSALQWFGDVTFWMFWANGYEALRALDDDGDGRLRGGEFAGLALWRDENGDGRSQRREVRPVAAWGIVELSCEYELDPRHQDEIPMSSRGVVFRDGSIRPTYDVLLHRARH